MNHVQKTFDNPKALKEIVEILPSDTVSVEKLKEILQMTLANSELVLEAAQLQDSLEQSMIIADNLDKRKAQNADFSTRIKLLSLADAMITLTTKSLASRREVRNYMSRVQAFVDSLKYEAPIYGYQINYRVERNKELKLESRYAYIDSLKGFLKILPQKIVVEDYSEQMQKGMKLSAETMKIVEELKRTDEEKMDNVKQMQSIMVLYTK